MSKGLFRSSLRPSSGHVVVLGLGRFGRAFAREAVKLGYDLVAVDGDQAVVDDLADEFPFCFKADTTSRKVLEELAVADAKLVLVATGSDIETSLLAVSTLVEMKVPRIWAKARSARHRDILLKLGAHRVSQPETSEGVRLAHQLQDGTHEFVVLDEGSHGDGFTVVELQAPSELVGSSVGDLDCRSRWGVNIVAVKHPDGRFSHADSSTVVQAGDLLVVVGSVRDTERFLGSD